MCRSGGQAVEVQTEVEQVRRVLRQVDDRDHHVLGAAQEVRKDPRSVLRAVEERGPGTLSTQTVPRSDSVVVEGGLYELLRLLV